MKTYKTLHDFGSDEYVVEKSTFIGYAKPIKSEEEAVEFINQIKKKHKDATHNVWAYTVGETMNIQRYSDDGEPQGTAGIPTLEVIKKEDLRDVVVVVTRYFGGIKLGAGGLVRAYSHGAKIALDASKILRMERCYNCSVTLSYDFYGKLSGLIPECGGIIDDSNFLENVIISFHIPINELGFFNKKLADATNGKIEVEVVNEDYFPM